MIPCELLSAVDRLPSVPLAQLPTPLQDCPRLAGALGIRRLFVKRDDLTGLAFGGNKTRKFCLTFADALQAGADSIITGSASQSNHARQAAAAASRLGLRCYLVSRWDQRARRGMQGNWLLDCVLGAEVRFVRGEAEQEAAKEQLAAELRAAGHTPYTIGDRATALGAVAYAQCTAEIAAELARVDACADVIACCSLEGTHGGLALGAKVLGMRARVIAWRPYPWDGDRTRRHIAGLANQAAEWLGLPERLAPAEIDNRGDAVGEAYGLASPEGMAALHLAARTEGLLLDPVYTGKALAGLHAAIRSGEIAPESTVVFVHTGGNPALFAYAGELADAGGYAVRYIEDPSRGVL
jgi:1-aminocyclopropane-1-carboxylate deaminase/D-cysteine desulfhydrase-like pyridoxal-dependent ACC family enzyme